MSGAYAIDFEAVAAAGGRSVAARMIAEEVPIAIEVNGLGYAVLMASPVDLVDLAYGFALAERLIDRAADIVDLDCHDCAPGIIVRLVVREPLAARVHDRVRHRATDASCGLCGIENLEQALRPLPRLATVWTGDDRALFVALAGLADAQPLNSATRSVHAAAACTIEGAVRRVREDVGRHNAFDKLIGSMLREGLDWEKGFALLTSRCSYELVEKAVLAGCPMLATISAPTRLAVDRARAAGLALRTLVRSDALLAVPDQ
jgi:FdhD protein